VPLTGVINYVFLHLLLNKGKGKGLNTCYSAACMSRLVISSAFTIMEVAADWHELVVLRRVMRPSHYSTRGAPCSTTDIPSPQSAALGLHLDARKLLLVK